jgi:hypothetical protein
VLGLTSESADGTADAEKTPEFQPEVASAS